jgi:crotonobetaine/carnitine-CoA ligase
MIDGMDDARTGPTAVLDELARAARESPDEVFLVLDDVEHTFASVHAHVLHLARGLRAIGIAPGHRVLVMLPNCIEAVWAWLGIHAAGAVDAPVSIETTGASLRHVVDEVEPHTVVATPELLARLADSVDAHTLRTAVVVDGPTSPAALPGVQHEHITDVLARGGESTEPLPTPPAGDLATIMFSSGSSGPPKGVMLPHGYYANVPAAHVGTVPLDRGSVVYCAQPLCHIDPRMLVLDALFFRCRMVLVRRFSASRYWDEVERYDADVFVFIGAMLPLLYKQPRRAPGRRRIGFGAAIPAAIHRPFSEEFNVELLEGYGMTEAYAVLIQRPGEGGPGNVGTPLPGVEIQVVDADGWPVPDGTAGELVVRPTRPFAVMSGYWRRPEATVEAWRGLWLHTGDLVRRHPTGAVEYAGRLKDSIRRRGENVSCWEVERATVSHPSVLEAAAIGVPSDLGEEDVALVIVPHPDGGPDPEQLREHLAANLPRYALPRFIDVVEALPKTPSERVAKAVLRERGLSSAVYDAERSRV